MVPREATRPYRRGFLGAGGAALAQQRSRSESHHLGPERATRVRVLPRLPGGSAQFGSELVARPLGFDAQPVQYPVAPA